mmetsp:Transcript_8133/g.19047  ORF Transcript_8133/g.19047 Transcript_8133/m.19047 type:complete len:284 (+) Transcript_8133:490-1341(+)
MAHIIFVVRRKVSAMRCETCGVHSATSTLCKSSRKRFCLLPSSKPVVAKTCRPAAAATAASAGLPNAESRTLLADAGVGVFSHGSFLVRAFLATGSSGFLLARLALFFALAWPASFAVAGLGVAGFNGFEGFEGFEALAVASFASLAGAVARRFLDNLAKGASESSSLAPLSTKSACAGADSGGRLRPLARARLVFVDAAALAGGQAVSAYASLLTGFPSVGPGMRSKAGGPPSSAGRGLCQLAGALVLVLDWAQLLAAVRLTFLGGSWLGALPDGAITLVSA